MYVQRYEATARPGQGRALGTLLCQGAATAAKVGGLPMNVLKAFAGAPSGTFANTMMGSPAELAAAIEAIGNDPEWWSQYQEMAPLLHQPMQVEMSEIVFHDSDPDQPAPIISVVTGMAKGDRIGEAIVGYVDLAKRARAAGAPSVAVLSEVSGPYGGLTLVYRAASMEAFESDRAAFFGEQSNLDALAVLSPLMIEGSGLTICFKTVFSARL